MAILRRLAILAALLASAVFGAPHALAQYGGAWRVEAAVLWDDNVNRARDADDKLSDRIYSLGVARSLDVSLGEHARLVGSGFVQGDKFSSLSRLDHASAGAQGELQYRGSAEFFAPLLGLFGRLAFDAYPGPLRSGHRYSAGLTYRQPLSDRISLFAALAANSRRAEHSVFDTTDSSARFSLDYALGWSGALYFGGEYRRGDVVTTLPPSPEYAALAKVSVQDDAYGADPRFAYRFDARTVLWTLGYNRPLGPNVSLDFFARRARSAPADPPGGIYAGSPPYVANQYSVALLMRF